MSRTVLLIAYEFPPSAGAGVQRVAKFARYLPDNGWRPVVLCAEPIPGRPHDASLLEQVAGVEVHRIPARHVADLVARTLAPLKRGRRRGVVAQPRATGASVDAAPVTPERSHHVPLSSRISRLVAIPDDAAYWIAGAVETGIRVGRRAQVDAVVASGPPYSVLVAGARVARAIGVPFVVDLRDAWTRNPAAAWPTALHRSRAFALEREVMQAAHAVVAVSEPIAEEADDLGAPQTRVLPNGYDPADMPQHTPSGTEGPLRLVFMGRVYGPTDVSPLIEAIGRLGGKVTLDVAGPDSPLLDAAIARAGAGEYVKRHGYLSHADALALAAGADVGVVSLVDGPESRSVYTGKLFEYLGMRLPVLLVGPTDGVAARLIDDSRSGWSVSYSDVSAIASRLTQLAAEKEQGTLACDFDPAVLRAFERPHQAAELAAVLDGVVS